MSMSVAYQQEHYGSAKFLPSGEPYRFKLVMNSASFPILIGQSFFEGAFVILEQSRDSFHTTFYIRSKYLDEDKIGEFMKYLMVFYG